MTQESKDDAFLEKIIFFLVILVGAVLAFNQFQYAKLSSNILLNALSFFLIFALIGLVAWLFLKTEKHEKHIEHEEKKPAHSKIHIQKNPFSFMEKLSWGFVALAAVLIFFNQFQISQVSALVSGTF